MNLPPDITAIPQIYEVECIIPGGSGAGNIAFNFTCDSDICTTTGFTIRDISDGAPNPLRHGLLTVTWEAENINIGNNDGDHRISCSAKSNDTTRTSEHITVRGNYIKATL